MYGALWRAVPAPWWVKVPVVIALVMLVIYGLFHHVFPYVSDRFFNPSLGG